MKSCVNLALPLCLLAASALAQPDRETPSAGENAAMEAMMQAATPGEPHRLLDRLVGSWDAEVTMWIDPSGPPVVSSGVSENRWILGGRWIEQRFRGTFQGAEFEGLGHYGYDNVKKKYLSSWMDNFSTWMMTAEGRTDAGGKLIHRGRSWDSMQGREVEIEDRTTFVGSDHVKSEMFSSGADGRPVKVMEIHYKRKK
ncbi:MAG TPA: DUF1579 domain-containing protein [Thermoanaerobaculia bacterium]|nr:DUF1579 domain-containing protein [Thermoanaerobaculia bacterium]